MARKILWGSLALAPIVFVADFVFQAGDVTLFALSAAALVPLARLIGEATEHAAEHTGPGVGGFLNASFGNAPELIIALFAVDERLPNVVRGSLTGSVVSNILLVLGFALVAGGEGRLDRRSLLAQLGIVVVATVVFLVPSVPGWHGDPERHSLAVASLPVAIVLLFLYLGVTTRGLRRHRRLHAESGAEPDAERWSLPSALLTLGLATGVTAVVSEILVRSLKDFAAAAHLSEFFTSAVIVAIVGNAAEHGGAIVIATRGKIRLATEIAVSSSAQVSLLVVPAVALLSFAFHPALPLAFRPVELAAMGGAALLVALLVADGRAHRWEGAILLAVYAGVAAGFWAAGDR